MKNLLIRIWDGEKMHYPHEDHDLKLRFVRGNWILSKNDGTRLWNSGDSEFPMMYSIGLNDTNDNLVWTGDVLKINMGNTPQTENFNLYDLEVFYSRLNDRDEYLRITKFEIIGNIYEPSKSSPVTEKPVDMSEVEEYEEI